MEPSHERYNIMHRQQRTAKPLEYDNKSFDLSTKSNRKFENTKLTYSCISLGPLNVPVCARERVVESSMTHRNEMCKRDYIHHDIVDDQAHTLTHPFVVVAGIEQIERRVFQL